MLPEQAGRRHELSFRQSFVLCRECGHEVDTLSAWLEEPCAGREAQPPLPLNRDAGDEREASFSG